MARYSDDSRERVRDAVDFVDLVGARTELRKAGARRYVGLCPFHDERSPSFGIDPVEKLYHCFGCGEGGDVFKFVMVTESLDFGAALESLADRAGVELERDEEDPAAAERRTRRERLLALLERTAAYYVRVLWGAEEAAPAREYLKRRGLQEATLRQFRVGYAPSGWDRVLLASRRAGYSEEELRACGLVTRNQEGRMYDAFRGRIMFPLTDRRGRVLGFGARAMRDNQGPKYVNSRDGEVYRKGRQLFAVDLARVAAGRSGSVVLAEGYTDVIAMHQAGFSNAVGLMGTALTEEQAAELGQLARTVLLCLDADAAGQEAMVRAAGLVAARGNELRVVPLPAGADPADIAGAQGGGEAIRALLDQAMPFARFQVERALDRAIRDTAEGRAATLAEVARLLAPMPQGVLREELVRLTAGRLRLSEDVTATVLGFRGTVRRGPTANGGPAADPRSVLDRLDRTERAFLALCLAMPVEGARRLASMDLEVLFDSPLTRRAAAFVRDHAASPASALPDDDPELAGLIAELVLRADEADPTSVKLDVEGLQLELAGLDRQIAAARAQGAAVTALAGERQRVKDEIRHKLH